MSAPNLSSGRVTLRLAQRSTANVRASDVSSHVVSVLFGSDIDEWRRGWRSTVGGEPRKEAVVSAADLTRGAAASPTTNLFPDRNLAYTQIDRSASAGVISETVAEYLSGSAGGATVLVDDFDPFLADVGAEAAVETLEDLVTTADECGASVEMGWRLTPETVESVESVADRADAVAVPAEVNAAVDRLRDEDPTTFGYLRRHWREARRGIEVGGRNYAQSKQVHSDLGETETTPRTLGMALSGLVEADVIDRWGDTVGSTRYDLTAYDPVRLALLGYALDAAE